MKKLLFVFACLLLTVIASGQHSRKSITDTVFQLAPAEVRQIIKKKVNLLNLEVPLKTLPLTVTTLSADVLERKNILNLEDAVRFLPGVTVKDQLGAFYRFSVRGSNEAVVSVDGFRDERSLLNNVPFADLSSIASIEVLKGAQAVLSGHSVMGGIINIVRKKAVPDFTAGARLSYGSWGVKSTSLDFGGKLAGPLTYRATAHYSTGDGYRHVHAGRFSATASLTANIGKTGYAEAAIAYNDDKYDTEIGSAPAFRTGDIKNPAGQIIMPAGSRNPFADYNTVYNDFSNNTMTRQVTDISLAYTRQLAPFMKLRDRFNWNHSDLDYACVEGMTYRTDTVDRFTGGYYYESKNKKYYIDLTDSLKTGTPLCFSPDSRGWTNMLELTGEFKTGSTGHKYILGYSCSWFNYTQYNGWNKGDVWGPGLNQLVAVSNPQLVRNWWSFKYSEASIREYRTSGLYLHDVLDFGTHWKAMGSVRMDFYRYQTATATIEDGRQHYEDANRGDWKKVKTSAFTGRAGIVYIPVDAVSLYASVGSHFKPYNTTYSDRTIYLDRNGNRFNPSEDGGEVFRPEKGYQAEAGIRYLWNNYLDFSGSVYYLRKNNVVKSLGTLEEEGPDGEMAEKNISGQVGTADSRGFDLELTLRPLPSLALSGGLGWQDYRVRKILKSKEFPAYTDVNKNQRATGIPRTTFYVYADYTIPQGILKNLSLHLSGTYQDKIFTDVVNRVYNPALFLMDGGLFYTIRQKVTLALNVDNLLDKAYFKSTTVPGKPRNFTGTVSCRF